MSLLQRRYTIYLFLKTFIAIVVMYSLALFATSSIIHPVTVENGIVVHLSAGMLQDMLNVKLRGHSYDEIAAYLNSRSDTFIGHAQIAMRSELLQHETSRRYGIELRGMERNRLMMGRAFTTGTWFAGGQPMPGYPAENHESAEKWRFGFGMHRMTYDCLIKYAYGMMHVRNRSWSGRNHENRLPFIVIPIEDTSYVVFARRPLPLPPEIMLGSKLLGIIVALIILTIATLVIIWPVVWRIRRIQAVCQRVTAGDYSARCNDKRQDSLGALACNIDEMTGAIERHLSQQKSLLQAVSHELRTPLARIRFTIEMIDIADDDVKGQERIESIDDDLTEIDNMLRELSYFNYVDAGKGREHFEEILIAEMIDAALKQRSQPLEPFNVQVEGLDDDMTVIADPTAFKRVIGNLLSNAARYAKESIVIRVRKEDARIEVAVEDDGPGIPEDKWHEVFEPFVCLDPSRSKSVGGVGLGLAICDRIMKIHHGEIRVEHAPLGGARMVTQWPISQA